MAKDSDLLKKLYPPNSSVRWAAVPKKELLDLAEKIEENPDLNAKELLMELLKKYSAVEN